jgi:hypothetical protein
MKSDVRASAGRGPLVMCFNLWNLVRRTHFKTNFFIRLFTECSLPALKSQVMKILLHGVQFAAFLCCFLSTIYVSTIHVSRVSLFQQQVLSMRTYVSRTIFLHESRMVMQFPNFINISLKFMTIELNFAKVTTYIYESGKLASQYYNVCMPGARNCFALPVRLCLSNWLILNIWTVET